MASGLTGLVHWYEDHPPKVADYLRLLSTAATDGAISDHLRADLAARTPIEGVAALRARLAQASDSLTRGGR